MTSYFYSGLYIVGLIVLLARAHGPADISGAIRDAVSEVGGRRPEGLTTVAATGKHIRVQLFIGCFIVLLFTYHSLLI